MDIDSESTKEYYYCINVKKDGNDFCQSNIVLVKLFIDTDKDGISDEQEAIYKTDPKNPDTDGDKLSDGQEVFLYHTNPLIKDTDGDRLTDWEEVSLCGTSPINKDTDGNGITDDLDDADKDAISNYNEILLGSDPRLVDSDNDGFTDGNEIKYGTNPLSPDSNGNGVKDGDEVFVSNIGINPIEKDEKVEPSIEMRLKGKNIDTVSISNVGNANPYLNKNMPGYIGAPFQFSSKEAFDSAKMTFTVDKTLFNDPNMQPAIYYFNDSTKLLELLPNQIVDTSKGTIVVDVKHFSTYIVLNEKAIDEVWTKEMNPPHSGGISNVALAIGFSIDSSGIMSSNDPNDLRKQTAKDFVDKLSENDKAAVIDFDSSAKVNCSLTNNKQVIKNAIERVDSSGGTDLGAGMQATINELKNSDAPVKYVIMLTAGEGSYDDSLTQKAKDLGIVVYTIGLGYSVDEVLLKRIAEQTGGKYYHAQQASDLSNIFDQTSEETVDLATDTDHDGLSDYHEKRGMRTNTGEWVYTDPENPDTDGDGINDGDSINKRLDPEPMIYSVTDKTLALSAGLSYNRLLVAMKD